MSISACMIVRNEEKLLPNCLDSIKGWVDEIIIVDTGSTDKTIEIAKSYGAKVYRQKWRDNFSFHRNHSISKATKDWIFIIDADEEVAPPHGEALKAMMKDKIDAPILSVNVSNLYGKEKKVQSCITMLRFFKRSSEPRYEREFHNRPVIKANSKIMMIDFVILHYGYGLDDEDRMREKYERMIRMGKKATELHPKDSMVWFYYARSLKVKDGKFNKEAVDEMVQCLEIGIGLCDGKNDDNNGLIQMLFLMSLIKYTVSDHFEAAKCAQEALKYKPDYLDAIMMLGYAYTYGINAKEGERWFKRYLEEQEKYDFGGTVNGLSMEMANARIEAYESLIDIEEMRNNLPVVDNPKQKVA